MPESGIKAIDEEIHTIGKEEHWQESWYFNFADTKHDLFGLTRIGFNFHTRKIDGLIIIIRDGQPEYVYPAVNVPFKGDWYSLKASSGLNVRDLIYKVEEPLKKWRLILSGKNKMDLLWEAFTPPFDYHDKDRELPPDVTGRHFEQSGKVTGNIHFKGKAFEINGTGQRDKSWGVRDWAHVEGWNWISAQFGENLSFNIWEGFFKGRRYQNGFVFDKGKNYSVNDIKIHFRWGKKEHIPLITNIEIDYGEGRFISVTARSLGHFPLIKKGLWIQESHSEFIADKEGAKIDGIGVIEHAWHAEKIEIFKRAPDIIRTALKVLL